MTNPTLTYNDGQHVRIVGHYDDPSAVECVIESADPPGLDGRTFEANDSAADVAVCRMRFVVTEVTPVSSASGSNLDSGASGSGGQSRLPHIAFCSISDVCERGGDRHSGNIDR